MSRLLSFFICLTLMVPVLSGCDANDANPLKKDSGSNGGGGGGGEAAAPAATPAPTPEPIFYTLKASVTGLAGGTLLLRNQDVETLTVSENGTHDFVVRFGDGLSYNVSVLTQPQWPAQTCIVASGSGTFSGSDVTLDVSCQANCAESHLINQPEYNITTGIIGTGGGSLFRKTCQSFTVSSATSLNNISLYIKKVSGGSATGVITAYTDVPGSTNCEAGSIISSSRAASYTSNLGWVMFEFPEEPALDAGIYRFVFTPDQLTYVYSNKPSVYAGGNQFLEMWVNAAWMWNYPGGGAVWDNAFRVNSSLCN